MFKEGQGGVQGACRSGMRWGKKRKQGWTTSQLDSGLSFRSNKEL